LNLTYEIQSLLAESVRSGLPLPRTPRPTLERPDEMKGLLVYPLDHGAGGL
jgi:hypothetical protein